MTNDTLTPRLAATDDGGPAFPTGVSTSYVPGMTMRDWFAGQIMPKVMETRLPDEMSIAASAAQLACYAYLIADAMLAERAKEERNG